MKYMLLIYSAESAWNENERRDCFTESAKIANELNDQGKYISAAPLDSVAVATSVRIRAGKVQVTDGPFAETREQLGGYFLIEANNLDEAIVIAGKLPPAAKGTVEVRPVLEISGIPVR
jgi:hypothetical protein